MKGQLTDTQANRWTDIHIKTPKQIIGAKEVSKVKIRLKKMVGKSLQIIIILLMFDKSKLSHFLTDSQKICDSLKELQKFFKMGPIWQF